MAVRPDRRAERILLLDGVPADDRPDCLAATADRRAGRGNERRRAAHPIVRRHAPVGVHEPLRSLADEGRPLWGAAEPSFLRDDLDDAVRRFGPVDGCRGWALENLDRLDVFGADVVETRGAGRALDPRLSGADVVRDTHAVDVQQRLLAERDRRATADVDARPGADAAGAGG